MPKKKEAQHFRDIPGEMLNRKIEAVSGEGYDTRVVVRVNWGLLTGASRFMQTKTNLHCFVPHALEAALVECATASGVPIDQVVQSALAQYLGTSFHTLFQVSTSGSARRRDF